VISATEDIYDAQVAIKDFGIAGFSGTKGLIVLPGSSGQPSRIART